MALLNVNCRWKTTAGKLSTVYLPSGSKFIIHSKVSSFIQIQVHRRLRTTTRSSASQNSGRKTRRPKIPTKKSATPQPYKRSLEEYDQVADNSVIGDGLDSKNNNLSTDFDSEISTSVNIPSRDTVLQACTITSGLIATVGVIIRQISHVASVEGWWSIPDCSSELSFSFEAWHLELIVGLVVLISSCRYLLLKTWPDFAESSEAANQQVLTALQPFDYIIVAFLPGVSEELLFRGAMLPLFGMNLQSALLVAVVFGFLHLGSGRKYSFAVWATFVGLAYGYAAILSSSIIVPMTSHALNNLVGGIIWHYSSNSSKSA